MAVSRSLMVGLLFSLICGSALATEVDQTGSLTEPSHQGMMLEPAVTAPAAKAALPELKVTAGTPRRDFYAPIKDKPWDPHICIGC